MRFPKTFAPGARTFVGFDQAPVDRLLNRFEDRVGGPPRLSEHSGITLGPLNRVERGWYEGGAFGASGFVTELCLCRGLARRPHIRPPPAVPMAVRSIAQAWFGGYAFDHYGHFLLEGLSRVLSPAVRSSTDPIVFLTVMRPPAAKGYMQQIFETIGIDSRRLLFCSEPLQVERLRTQEPALEIGGFIRPAAYEGLVPFDEAPPERRGIVYLSRSRLKGRRSIRNETALEAILAERWGARIVYPETHPVEEQIALFRSAAMIVACEGSALHTILLAGAVAQTVMLTAPKININYLLCDEACAGDTVYVRALTAAGQLDNGQAELDVDLDRTLSLLAPLLS